MANSKTALRSTPSTAGKVTPESKVATATTAATPRLIPLAGGRFVYFANPLTGSTTKLRTDSDEFVEALRKPCALGLAVRIRAELTEFATTYPSGSWDKTIQRLVDAEVL